MRVKFNKSDYLLYYRYILIKPLEPINELIRETAVKAPGNEAL